MITKHVGLNMSHIHKRATAAMYSVLTLDHELIAT